MSATYPSKTNDCIMRSKCGNPACNICESMNASVSDNVDMSTQLGQTQETASQAPVNVQVTGDAPAVTATTSTTTTSTTPNIIPQRCPVVPVVATIPNNTATIPNNTAPVTVGVTPFLNVDPGRGTTTVVMGYSSANPNSTAVLSRADLDAIETQKRLWEEAADRVNAKAIAQTSAKNQPINSGPDYPASVNKAAVPVNYVPAIATSALLGSMNRAYYSSTSEIVDPATVIPFKTIIMKRNTDVASKPGDTALKSGDAVPKPDTASDKSDESLAKFANLDENLDAKPDASDTSDIPDTFDDMPPLIRDSDDEDETSKLQRS